MAQQPLVGKSLLTIEASRSHSETPHTVGCSGRVISPSQRWKSVWMRNKTISLDTGYRKSKKTMAICQHTRRECARHQEVLMSRTRVQH